MDLALDAIRNHIALRRMPAFFFEDAFNESARIMNRIDIAIKMMVEIPIYQIVRQRIVDEPQKMSGDILSLNM